MSRSEVRLLVIRNLNRGATYPAIRFTIELQLRQD